MQHVNRFLTLMFLLLVISIPSHSASADVGPKPTMDFTFVQEFAGDPVTIVSGVLLQCDAADCQDAAPLQELGPQRFTCEALRCHALAYGFSAYNRLEITFSDGVVRRSNVFPEGQFNGTYTVTIKEQDLLVEEKFNPSDLTTWPLLCLGGACLAGILLVVALVLILRRLKKKA